MGKIQLFDFRNFFKGYPLFLQELYKKTPGKKFFPRCSSLTRPEARRERNMVSLVFTSAFRCG